MVTMEFVITASRFEAHEDDQLVGWLDYSSQDQVVSMPHTEVPPEFSGRGIGGQLVGFALAYARDHGWSVLPVCPFIRNYMVTHPEFQDLVPENYRPQFDLETPPYCPLPPAS